MRLKITPIIYRAICNGIAEGFSVANENKDNLEQNNPSILLELLSAYVLRSLQDVLDFEENLALKETTENNHDTNDAKPAENQ